MRNTVLLLYKNALLKRASKGRTFCELLTPFIFSGLLVAFWAIFTSSPGVFGFGAVSTVPPLVSLAEFKQNVYYVDETGSSDVTTVMTSLGLAAAPIALANTSVLDTTCVNDKCSAAVVFTKADALDWRYALRFPASKVPDTTQATTLSVNISESGGAYQQSGFLSWQLALSQRILELTHGLAPATWTVDVESFTSLTQDQANVANRLNYFNNINIYIGTPFLVFMFLGAVYCLMADLVVEKQSRIKEAMKMMGLTDLAYYASWIITALFCLALPLLGCAAMLQATILAGVGFGSMYLFWMCYGLSLIALCFVLSVFVSKPEMAGVVGGFFVLAFTGAGVALTIVDAKSAVISVPLKNLASLVSPIGFCFGNAVLFNNAIDIADVNGYTLLDAIALMLVDTALYTVLAWYFANVFPGDFGTSLPWLFPFMASYWFPSSALPACAEKDPLRSTFLENEAPSEEDLRAIEVDDNNLSVGISVQNLRKVYATQKGDRPAVDGLSFTAFEGQVLALLGHNGAGKTSTIAMLTGLYPPTSGDAIVNDYSIRSEMQRVRQSLGVCPQHDVIWETLTVRQTLTLYAGLKGIALQAIPAAVAEMIADTGLHAKADTLAGSLSGGQKRKLCLGIAFIGNSKVVVLDEVTSGMDPFSRRAVWDLVESKKHSHTVVLTTHFLDEADLLGDRIAIMSRGKLRALGSGLFLKSRFGIGYTLTLVMSGPGQEAGADVLRSIQDTIPQAAKVSSVGTEYVCQLPMTSAAKFPALFRRIEENKAKLYILSYGISITTLEEVFLRIADENKLAPEDPVEENSDLGQSIEARRETRRNTADAFPGLKTQQVNKPSPRVLTQLRALLTKRFLCTLRDPKMLVLQLLVPIIFIIFAGVIMQDILPTNCLPPAIETSEPLVLSWSTLFTSSRGDNVPANPDASMLSTADPAVSSVSLPSSKSLKAFVLANRTNLIGAVDNCCTPGVLSNFTAVANAQDVHAFPALINLVTNAMADSIAPLSTGTQINVTSHPLPKQPKAKLSNEALLPLTGFGFALLAGFGFLPSASVVFLVQERNWKAKHQQLVSGASAGVYWLSNFLWDYFVHLLVTGVTLIVFAGFQGTQLFVSDVNFAGTFILLLCYGLSTTTMVYCWSFMFAAHGTAQGGIFGAFLGLGFGFIVVFINIAIQGSLGNIPLFVTSIVIAVFGAISPPNALIAGLWLVANFAGARCAADSNLENSPLQLGVLGVPIIVLLSQTVVFVTATVVIENWSQIVAALTPKSATGPSAAALLADDDSHVEDADVNAERALVERQGNAGPDDLIFVRNLRKEYPPDPDGKVKLAVKNLSVHVRKGECVGLLGPNGAGKTSTLSILSGDNTATAGQVTVNGFDLESQLGQVKSSIGFCPQFDALLPLMTVREHLWLYARLKGIDSALQETIVGDLLRQLRLDEYADRYTHALSGGNKRKLSLAMALIGDPKVIFLDEPSTGMDPAAKRFMWSVISDLAKGRAIVMTTHSMEEADALCTKIGIMVDGRLRCLGSPQHLKGTYGQGYTLAMRTTVENAAALRDFVSQSFPAAQPQEDRSGYLSFELPREQVKLDKVFEAIEGRSADLHIKEYSVSQTTLEQIFLFFGKQQAAVMGADDKIEGGSPFVIKASNFHVFLNVVHCMFGGILLPGFSFVIGLLVCVSILGYPIGKMLIRVAIVSATPFGRDFRGRSTDIPSVEAGFVRAFISLVWLPFGIYLCVLHVLLAGILFLTIVGIPFALKNIELAKFVLAPFGRHRPQGHTEPPAATKMEEIKRQLV